MFKENGFLTRALVMVLSLTILWGCQVDSMNPVVPQGHSQPAAVAQPVENTAIGSDFLIGKLLGTVTRLVTPLLGGTLQVRQSKLVVPPFAVLMPTLVSFTITVGQPTGLPGALNREYYFAPHGLNFLSPSKLYVTFNDAGLGNANPYQYQLYYYNQSLNRWEAQPTVVDAANQRFVVTLNHFSRYAFAR